MSSSGPSSKTRKSGTVVPAQGLPGLPSVNHRLGLSDSDSWADTETSGDEGQWPEKKNPTQSSTNKRKQKQDPQNPAPKRSSKPTLRAECLAHTHPNSGLDLVGAQAAKDILPAHKVTAFAKGVARARLAEFVDDENGWTELLIEPVPTATDSDPKKPVPYCTIDKLASLQQYSQKLSVSNTACLKEKDERINSLNLQLQEVRKETGQLNTANEQAHLHTQNTGCGGLEAELGAQKLLVESKQTEINGLTQANQKLTKDLESKQLDIDNQIRDVETTRRELEAGQQDIQRVEAERDGERQGRKMQLDVFKQMCNLPPSLQLAGNTQHLVIRCLDKHRPMDLRCFVMAKDCVVFSTLADGINIQWIEESPLGTYFFHEGVPYFDLGIERRGLRYLELDENPAETRKWIKDRYPMREATDDEVRELD